MGLLLVPCRRSCVIIGCLGDELLCQATYVRRQAGTGHGVIHLVDCDSSVTVGYYWYGSGTCSTNKM
eukprot:scaffold11346_cov99-Amphora_coffeaeformis.AAC.1